jgi:hypothetical protein
MKMKATIEMIEAIKSVQPCERRAAMLLAERTFHKALATLTAWGDFSHADHVEMAGKAAAAEVAFKFA